MKIKTSELTGAALDWAVHQAWCEGACHDEPYPNYSTDWGQGGPIIEREEIGIQCIPAGTRKGWWALVTSRFHDRSSPDEVRGDTPLIAACRCYVASKLGDAVDIPEELI